jgi:hypothetical protein
MTGMEASPHAPHDEVAAMTADAFLAEDGNQVQSRRLRPFPRFRSIAGRAGVDDGYVERMETELALLREENARLRVERVQRPDAAALIERLRALSSLHPGSEDHRDEAWHLVGEALVMREVLVDVCKEIGQTAITLQTRLGTIGLDLPERIAADTTPAGQPALAPSS